MRAGLALAIAVIPAPLLAAPPAERAKPVDVVLCLDTSGSMDGLIDSAKIRLWALVNDLAKMQPAPSDSPPNVAPKRGPSRSCSMPPGIIKRANVIPQIA